MPLRIGYPYAYSDWVEVDQSECVRLCMYVPPTDTRVHAMIRTSGSGAYTMTIRAGVEPVVLGDTPTEPAPHSRNPGLGLAPAVLIKEGCFIGTGNPGIVVIKQRLGPDMSAREIESDEVSMMLSPGVAYMVELENCSKNNVIDINWVISWYENPESI